MTCDFPHVASGFSNASSRRNAVFKRPRMVFQLRCFVVLFFLRKILFLGTATYLHRWLYVCTRLPAPQRHLRICLFLLKAPSIVWA